MRITLFYFFCLITFTELFSQAPANFSYQAVIRKADNTLAINQAIGIKVSILSGSSSGIILFSEIQNSSTNANGLLTFNIGLGQNLTGSILTLDWSQGPFFIKTEYDLNGGSNYTLTSTSQILSVPYSLYSERSKTLHKHYIGEMFGGGIIFYVYNDLNGEEHGLIMSLEDLSENQPWSNVIADSTIDSKSLWDGQKNTISIINQRNHSNSAALLCRNYVGGGHSDWYLPSIDEMSLIFNSRFEINRIVNSDALPETKELKSFNYYWTSTEAFPNTAWVKYFAVGTNNTIGKGAGYSVRAIRKF